jgi:hypothetical protein
VLILPIVGLFIAFGNIFGNGNLAEYLPFLGHPLIQHTGQLIANLPSRCWLTWRWCLPSASPLALARAIKAMPR